LRERFIKNKRPLNPTHISLKKEKQLDIKITIRAILIAQFDDEERQEDIAMKGIINLQ
jgi:hypothetical protein